MKNPGGLAQLGEHLLCKQGVVGSIPSSSTIGRLERLGRLEGIVEMNAATTIRV